MKRWLVLALLGASSGSNGESLIPRALDEDPTRYVPRGAALVEGPAAQRILRAIKTAPAGMKCSRSSDGQRMAQSVADFYHHAQDAVQELGGVLEAIYCDASAARCRILLSAYTDLVPKTGQQYRRVRYRITVTLQQNDGVNQVCHAYCYAPPTDYTLEHKE